MPAHLEATAASRPSGWETKVHAFLHSTSDSLNRVDCGAGSDPKPVFTEQDAPGWTGVHRVVPAQDGTLNLFAELSSCDEMKAARVLQFECGASAPYCRQRSKWTVPRDELWHVFRESGSSRWHMLFVDTEAAGTPEECAALFWSSQPGPAKRVRLWSGRAEGLEPAGLRDAVFRSHPDGTRGLVLWVGCNLKKLVRRNMLSRLAGGEWRTVPIDEVVSPSNLLYASETSGYFGCLTDNLISIVPFTLAQEASRAGWPASSGSSEQ